MPSNCFDGLDPKFIKVVEILVIGNSLVTFVVNVIGNSHL